MAHHTNGAGDSNQRDAKRGDDERGDDERAGTGRGDGIAVDLQLQHEVVAVQVDTELHLLVELTMPPAPADANRQPLRLAMVVDRSASMGGGKLAAAKQAAAHLVDQLAPEDHLALVAYGSDVQLVAPLAAVDAPALKAKVNAIHTTGMTNLSGGWFKGVQELRKAHDGLRRVLLLSDGRANEGITDPQKLTEAATTLGANGITTTTIGFGADFDEHLMSALADAGRGSAHFAEAPEDAPGIFAEEFTDLVSVAAQNVTVEVAPSHDVEVIEVLNTFPSVGTPDGVQVEVGDANAGQAMRVVCRLHVPAMAELGLANVGQVTVRWIGVDDQVTEHVVSQPLVVNAVSADDAAAVAPNEQVVQEATILAAGKAAERARDLAEQGEHEEARRLVAEARASLADLPGDHVDLPVVAESLERMGRSAASMADGKFSAADSKRLHYESRRLRSRKRRPDPDPDRDDTG